MDSEGIDFLKSDSNAITNENLRTIKIEKGHARHGISYSTSHISSFSTSNSSRFD